MCGLLSFITVVTDIFGRFLNGTTNLGLTTFLCFLPMCFFHVGVMLKNLRDENRELKRRIDEMLLKDDEDHNKAAKHRNFTSVQ
jgi:hypothetical protein